MNSVKLEEGKILYEMYIGAMRRSKSPIRGDMVLEKTRAAFMDWAAHNALHLLASALREEKLVDVVEMIRTTATCHTPQELLDAANEVLEG